MLKPITVAVLMLTATGAALAEPPAGPTKPSKVVSKVHQPVGTPHKASALAPRHTNQRVFGAPIQAPIVHSAPAPKPK
jgi:hypothetical protein